MEDCEHGIIKILCRVCNQHEEFMNGVVMEIEPTRNAVIVEFHESGQKIVHLECIDESKQAELEEYAFSLLKGMV